MKYYIKTFGCQMNVYDSQRIARILQNMGHTPAASPAEAGLIIFNTCHIREKAAEKLFSDLGRINLIKEERKAAGLETIIGVVGCVVQAEDGEIARRAPFVNFATGPLTYYRIPEILQKIARDKDLCIIYTEFTAESKFDHLPENRSEGACSYLAVQEGCNNFCTYCIVPYTRGVETSRPVEDVLKEARRLVETGTLEINLLGQNVNSYHGEDAAGKERDLAYLLRRLAEIDGFDSSKGVVILAATSRPEILDKALLRAGRFDRRIIVDRPNLQGRYQTLRVHTKNIKLAEDVDLHKIAQATAGAVGADLANLANEAALRAVRKGRKLVTQEDMLAAFEFVIAGSEKKGSVLTEFEKKLVAYHEVGHAMVAYKQKNAEPVQKITIVPHTEGSLGYTLLMPEEDKTNLRTRDELMAKIAVSMGGRVAEEVVMNTMTNGASQDIQEATSIARNMVAMYGMSDAVGMVALGSVRNQYLDGGYGLDCAQDTAAIMDREVKRILDECYKDAVQVIRDNREDMDKVVAYLLEKETITGGEMVAILEGRDPSTVEEAYASTRKSEDGFRPSQPSVIEAPAKHISMTSEKIEMPPEDKGEETSTGEKHPAEPEAPADEPKGETKDAPSDEESK